MSKHILHQNTKVTEKEGLFMALEAIALGNPWVEPSIQYDVSDFARAMGLLAPSQEQKVT